MTIEIVRARTLQTPQQFLDNPGFREFHGIQVWEGDAGIVVNAYAYFGQEVFLRRSRVAENFANTEEAHAWAEQFHRFFRSSLPNVVLEDALVESGRA